MTDQLGKETRDARVRHRAHFELGVIMVPTLEPRRRFSPSSALERQLELLQMEVARQANIPRLA